MSDLITIYSSVVPESARVVGFRGTETISRPYEIEIFLQLKQEVGEEFDLSDAIGAKARLVLDRSNDKLPPFIFAGIFANIEILHAYEGHVLLRALLVPRLWQLGLSKHSRIFTKMKVPDIIKAVLEENGVTDFELRLTGYEVEEHVCQYRESDLDFISRWMEREGIFYFFEHGDAGETMILCDQRLYDEDPVGKPVRYFPQLGHDHSAGASFRAFKCKHSTLPANVRLKDYDYTKPSLNVSGSAKVASNGTGEVSLYGERFFTPSAGDKLARTRSEELLTRQVIFHGEGTRLHLRPGYTFELEEHPFASFNTRYLTIEAHHSGNQSAGLAHFRELTGIDHSDVYQVEIDSIPAKTQYRAQSLTHWPRIYGYENGVVDGPADSEYAQIDEHGRYNAKFKFDESKLKGGKATTWVRMMQPHGGDIEGFHFPLRKQTEVVFSFLGGDCDRPVIFGVVPNTVNPSPITSANHTKNVIQTGGRNRLELEDKAGQQRITLSTPYSNTYIRMGAPNDEHEMILHTDEQTLLDAGLDFNVTVSNAGAGNWTTIVNDGFATLSIPKGNYRIGVKEGIGIAAEEGLHLVVNGGFAIPAAGGPGGIKVEVLKEGIEVMAKEEIFIHSDNNSIKIEAKNKVEIIAHGDQKIDTKGKTWEVKTEESREEIHADSWEYRYANSYEETHGNKTEKMFGNSDGETHGNKTETMFGNSTETTHGNKSETFIGNKIEMLAGGYDISLSATGFKLEAALVGADLDISVTGFKGEIDLTGLKVTLEAGVALELNFAEVFELAPFHHDIEAAKLSTVAADIATTPTHTRLGGLFSNLAGLFAVV
jgi:type VI secretion system secreted protein VgrG